ncbi:MAG: sigma-70 family RNA polymerase sigma factor [Gemmataceae bacterium]|nr:sigma-70 family RNA polymerase sigma factor [Gemmataceae bacterium]
MARTAPSPILQLIRRAHRDPRAKDSPDQGLLRQFLGERDEAAFEALLRRHGPMVLDVCRSVLGNEADAEDAFQATFLTLARKAGSIRKAASLASWLHGVAYRTALRARADSARRQRHEARAPERGTPTGPDELTWREARQAVHEELARLPERHRAALVLCYLEGKTQDEAAAQLGLAKGTLKGHLERGRALLRARLVSRGLGPGAVLALGAWPAATRAASLSPPLLVPTVKAATAVATGGSAASAVSPNVAALSEGMVKAMFVKKLTIAALLFLAIAGSGAGLALSMQEPPRAGAAWRAGRVNAPVQESNPQSAIPNPQSADPGRPIRTLAGHRERVTSVAYSPDGLWIATAAWDGTARLWDANSGKEVSRLEVPATRHFNPARFCQIVFSPDSAFLVTVLGDSPDEAVLVWDRRTGDKVRRFPGGCIAFSPDGKMIACGERDVNAGVIRLYEFSTGKRVREMRGNYSRIDLLAFSPDGKTLFSQVGIPRPQPRLGEGIQRLGEDGAQVRVWDVATGKERRTGLEGAWNELHMTLSPDGRTLAVRGISLLETATGRERLKLTGHTADVCSVAFSPDGRTLASGSMDGTVRLWDLPSGREVGRLGEEARRFEGRRWVLAVAFSPDGRSLVSGGLDQTAHIWDVSRITGRPRGPVER